MATAQGTEVSVFYNAETATFEDQAAIKTFVEIEGNVLLNVTDLGAIESAITIIEFPVYGETIASKIVGLDTPADMTLDIAFDPAIDEHLELSDAAGVPVAFAIVVSDGTANVYYGVEGICSTASMSAPVDGVSTLSLTVALTKQVSVGDGEAT